MELATTFFSVLTVLSNLAILVWIGAVAGGQRTASLRTAITASVAPAAIPLALLIATTSMVASLYYSEVAGLVPCELCWYQRIAMYPLAFIFAVAAWRRDPAAWKFSIPLVAAGTLIAGYHYLIQRVPSLDAGTCSATVPCSTPYFLRFGFISFPYLSASAFLAIATLYWITTRAEGP